MFTLLNQKTKGSRHVRYLYAMEPEIVFEDGHLIVLNKPAGIVVELDRFGYPSLERWVRDYFNTIKLPSNAILGIVHRIDRPVSGLVIMAKKKSVLVSLNTQFADGTVQKKYLAMVTGNPQAGETTLSNFLMKDPVQKKAIIAPKKSKRAVPVSITYKHLGTYGAAHLLEVHPHSGKYHQIRAQLAAAELPIVGDALYGSNTPFHTNMIKLHASAITCIHPATQSEVTFSAPIPDSWGVSL